MDVVSARGMGLVCTLGEDNCPLDSVRVVDETPSYAYIPGEILGTMRDPQQCKAHDDLFDEYDAEASAADPIIEEATDCLRCVYEALDALRASSDLHQIAQADQADAFLRDNADLFVVPELIGTIPQIFIRSI